MESRWRHDMGMVEWGGWWWILGAYKHGHGHGHMHMVTWVNWVGFDPGC